MNNKVHRWFDALPEPKRMLTFLIPTSLLIMGSTSISDQGIQIGSIILLVLLAVSRVTYMNRNRG